MPSSSFFQPLITNSTYRPLCFGKFLSNNAVIVSFWQIRLRWFCQGSQSAHHFHPIYLLPGGGCFFAFTPSKKFLTSSRAISAFSSRVLTYGNFSGVFREGLNLYVLPPLAVLLDAGRADRAVVFFTCLGGRGEGLRRAGAAAGLFRPC